MPTETMTNSYHDRIAVDETQGPRVPFLNRQFTYTFENFFHPFVGEMIERLNRASLGGVLDAAWQADRERDFFPGLYAPAENRSVHVESFAKAFDVDEGGPYAAYNWELFFHLPLTVAVHLGKTQRFAEAQRWFHYIFDPTSNDTSDDPPKRFWRFLAFRDDDPTRIDELLALLSRPETDPRVREAILNGYQAILDKPFQPHAVARTRRVAYQYSVVMKYLDNLIAWGDHLFRQDTVESINEATQLYVLAANLLGPRPQRIPPRGTVRPRTFAQLEAAGLDPMGNALVELEGQFPFNLASPSPGSGDQASAAPLFGIGRTLYFCIPRNDKLLGYWDTVADRLFKIRHCLNVEGVARPLALFDPPIDPGMLVKAAAAGLDVGAVVSSLNQPLGPVRCQILIQKALELSGEVRGLGGALLSALEKGDVEHLALVRQRHEIEIQKMIGEVRFLQWQATRESTTSLLTSRATSLERFRYFQRQLGLPADPNAPDTLALDRTELTEANFDVVYNALVGQYDKALGLQSLPAPRLASSSSPAAQSGASGQGPLYLNANEDADLNDHGPEARLFRALATANDGVSQVLALIPDFGVDLHFWGLGGNAKVVGGSTFAAVARIVSGAFNTNASDQESRGSSASKTAGYERRGDDWILQYNLAAHELMQIGRQILTSLIAEQIAHHEYLNARTQFDDSREVDRFLHDKFTDEELYLWMQGEISRLYYEYYRLAFDAARKAERTMKREVMRPELDAQDFVKFNYWDGGRKGLLSGEALYLDVKRMELAYYDNNRRELELTRHVSLRQLDPLALLTLKVTGRCTVTIPEWLYDRDSPGHYMRRIKSVAVSIPSVVGPYTSVNCTLSLLRSTVRRSPLPKDGEYARQGSEDDRFVDYVGAVQSIVTSSANGDSGMFETNLRDDRFLPFEGAGAESTWSVSLPADYRAFDYDTISDVVLHVRYTARQGVEVGMVTAALDALVAETGQTGLALLFSVRHDFPNEWAAFANGPDDLSIRLRKEYFPYFVQGRALAIDSLDLYAAGGGQLVARSVAVPANLADELNGAAGLATLSLAPDDNVLTRDAGEVFLIVRYSL